MTELFSNRGSTTVVTGGTDAPAAGTVETWTVASSATFPAAVTGVSQFHVSDQAAPSEIIAVTNVSGTTWTVTRGAESTIPVAHAPGFAVYNIVTAGALTGFMQNPMTAAGDLIVGGTAGAPARLGAGSAGQVLITGFSGTPEFAAAPVDWINAITAYGADPTGVTDSTTAIQNAVNAAATAKTKAYLPAGTYLVSSTITNSTGYGFLVGDGPFSTIINFTGTGDCIRWYNSTYGGPWMTDSGGGVQGIKVDGTNAGAGSCGLHTGDQTRLEHDIAVTNFSGSGDIGVHLDNTIWWTEQMDSRLWVANCTTGIVFDVSGATTSTNSFDYNNLNIYTNCAKNQNGIVVQNGAYLYNSNVLWRGNFFGDSSPVTGVALTVTGTVPTGHPNAGAYSAIIATHLDIHVEVTGTFTYNPVTMAFGSTSNTISGVGIIQFGGTWSPSATVLGSAAPVLNFNGYFNGDTNLNKANNAAGVIGIMASTKVSTGFATGWSGFVQFRRLGNFRVQAKWSLSVASGTALTTGAIIFTVPAGYYYTSDTTVLPSDISISGVHTYAPVAITAAGNWEWGAAAQTPAATGYWYGQAEYELV